MRNPFIAIRRWERPDRPQPVYKGALSTLWEAFRYPPIGDETRNTSDRTGDRRRLDVRTYEWFPQNGWIQPAVDRVTRTWIPSFDAEAAAFRSDTRRPLDVRQFDWSPQPAWIFSAVPPALTTAQQWPAVLQNLPLSYRVDGRASLNVCDYDWSPDEGWLQPAADAITQTWAGVFASELASFRTGERARLDTRPQEQPGFEWVQPVVDATVSTWAPVFQAELGLRTPDSAKLDVRQHEWTQPAWTFAILPVGTTIDQQWPAVLSGVGLSYRSLARPLLEVRSYEWAPQFTWVNPIVDAAVAEFVAAVTAQGNTYRSGDGPSLEVRAYEWAPSFGWIVTVIPVAAPTVYVYIVIVND